MKKLLLGTAMSIAVVGGASAADLYTKAPAPFSWTGCYVGVAGGGAWGRSNQFNNAVTPVTITGDFNISGGIFGGTVGCNYQVSRNFVIGIEDDLSWTNKKGSVNDSPPFNTTFTSETHEKWIDTLRARAGFVVPGGALLYATGGAAFANYGITVCSATPVCTTEDQTRTGWTVGGGVEFWIPNTKVSLKGEYLYVGFQNAAFFNPSPNPVLFVDRAGGVKMNDNIVRGGLNWHF